MIESPNRTPANRPSDLQTTLSHAREPSRRDPSESYGELELRTGDQAGRYLLLEKLGSGAMGVVYQAYDPDLNRKVALKFIQATSSSLGSTTQGTMTAQSRLLHEAQAMARLSHPHVVGVYDVGMYCGHVFLAMELVEGQTMKGWIRQAKFSRTELLKVMIAAGRGLASAHEAGLVHRDFKPDNVLLGNDGRVCVADFGLVRQLRNAGHRQGEEGSEMVVMGTPSYMSPEQHRGELATDLSDQYSFCVCLFEALYGVRPFLGRNLPEIAKAIEDREMTVPAKGHDVPRWLHRIVVRGLNFNPKDRYPSMRALLSDLSFDRSAAIRKWAFGGIFAASFLASIGYHEIESRASPPPCPLRASSATEVWTENIRFEVRQTFLGSGLSHASSVWSSVDEIMSRRVDEWSTSVRTSCERRTFEDIGFAGPLSRRLDCLESQLSQMRAFSELLLQADISMMERSVDVAGELSSSEECENVEQLEEMESLPKDPRRRQEVQALKRELAKAHMMRNLGKIRASLEQTQSLVQRAEQSSFLPLLASIHLQLSISMFDFSDVNEGEFHYYKALAYAEASGDDMVSAKVVSEGIFVYGVRLRDPVSIDAWVSHAKAHLIRVHGNPRLKVRLLSKMGSAFGSLGRLAESGAAFQEAIEISETMYGREHLTSLGDRHNYSRVLALMNKPFEALEEHRKMLESGKKVLGPDHSLVVYASKGVAEALTQIGRYEEAIDYVDKGLDIAERAGGVGLSRWLGTYNFRGQLLFLAGKHRRSLRERRRVVEIVRKSGRSEAVTQRYRGYLVENLVKLGQFDEAYELAQLVEEDLRNLEENPRWSPTYMRLIELYLKMGNKDHAEELLEKVTQLGGDLVIWERGRELPAFLAPGNLHLAKNRPDEAMAYYQKVYALALERFPGEDNVNLVPFERALARSSAAMGETLGGISWMEKALSKLHKGHSESSQLLASSYFQLARLQEKVGRWKDAKESIHAAESHIVAEEMDPREIAEIVEFKVHATSKRNLNTLQNERNGPESVHRDLR